MKKETIEKLNSILSKIGKVLDSSNGKVSLSEDKITLAVEGTLADGTKIGTPGDSFAVGVEVYILDADGNPVPAPDGTHIIDGVLEIQVVDGKITEAENVEMKSELSAEIEGVLNALTDRIADLEKVVNAGQTELESAKATITETEAKLRAAEEKVKSLEKLPGALTARKEAMSASRKEVVSSAPTKSWAYMTTLERIQNPEANPNRNKVK